MSTTVYPGATSAVSFTDAPTGLVGTFGWQLLNAAGTVIQARVTTSVTETPSGSGIYRVSVTWPTTVGTYRLIADTGTITPDTVAEEELITHVKGALAHYKAPKNILFVDTVGRAPNGKVDYKRMKQHALDELGVEA